MRRKSTRNTNKSPEKVTKEAESPVKGRRGRRRKRSPSKSSESEDEPLVPQERSSGDTPDTTTKSHTPSDEEVSDKPVWKVTSSEDTPKGEIQKLKICLTRPSPDSPEKLRTRRSKSNSQTEDDTTSSEDKSSSRRTRSRGSPFVDEAEEKKGKGKSKDKHKSKIEKSPQLNENEGQTMNIEISENAQVTHQSPTIDKRVDFETDYNNDDDVDGNGDKQTIVQSNEPEKEIRTDDDIEKESDIKQNVDESRNDDDNNSKSPIREETVIEQQPTVETETETTTEIVESEPKTIETEPETKSEPEQQTEVAEIVQTTQNEPETESESKQETIDESIDDNNKLEVQEEIRQESAEVVDETSQMDTSEEPKQSEEKPQEQQQQEQQQQQQVEEETSNVTETESVKELTRSDSVTSSRDDQKEQRDDQKEQNDEAVQSIQSDKPNKIRRRLIRDKISDATVEKREKKQNSTKWLLNLDETSSTLVKIDLETIQNLCPTIEFPEEPDLNLDVTQYNERRKSIQLSESSSSSAAAATSSTTTATTVKKLERNNSGDYKSDSSEKQEQHDQENEDKSNIIAFNRKISIVDDTASKLRPPPSPAKNPTSNVLFITNLVRPFTLKQLKELLERTGKIHDDGFWTDKIKSKCYVQYETTEEAETTRNALHGVQWPIGNGKKLMIDYATVEDLENAKNPPAPPVVAAVEPPVPVKEIEPTDDKIKIEEKKPKEMERRKPDGPIREWDIGKKDVRRDRSRSRDRDRERDRERDRSRKHRRSPSIDDFISKKQRKEDIAPQKLMDDLFLKTKATPSIYWQPLSPEEIATKQQQRLIRMEEHKRRMEESSRMKSRDGGRGSFRRRYD